MKKIIALILVIVSLFSVMSISVYAEGTEENTVTVTVNDVEFVFDADTSEEFRSKAIAHYFNHDGTVTYGLTCTLFGHKLENSLTYAITHKVRSTDPRCYRETYNTEVCSRCDYTNSTLISTSYISCC